MNGKIIQELKKNRLLSYRGLNLGSSISAKLYDISMVDTFKFVILGIFFQPQLKERTHTNSSQIIFSRNFSSEMRPDFHEMYSFVDSCIDSDALLFKRRLDILRSPKTFFIWLYIISKNFRLHLTINELISVSSLEVYYRKMVRKLDSFQWDKYSCYVSFCDSYLEENLMAQMAKLNGLVTITLQHGQYKNTGIDITTDSESYLNFISDYMLVWGQATVDQMVSAGVSKNRLLLSGVPKYIYDKRHLFSCGDIGSVCIYLNGDNHFESNYGMVKVCLEYCEKNGIDFYIRRHPSSVKKLDSATYNSKLFKGFISGNQRVTPLNVVNSSGVSMDIIMRGGIVAIYVDENTNELYQKLGLHFHDLEGLACQFECGLSEAKLTAQSYLNFAHDEAHAKSLYHEHITGAVSDID